MQDLNPQQREQLLRYIGEYVTDNKKRKIRQVLEQRTRHLVVALEDIYQSQNASAVLRSCDCFGIQEAHIIENDNEYKVNPDVAQGSEKWVDIIKHNQYESNTKACLNELRERGYRIVATVPEKAEYPLEELPIQKPSALVFGTELEGITDTVKQMADTSVQIPMYGFTPSFNISVSAALVLYELTRKMRQSGVQWQLSELEKQEITLRWYKKILKKADRMEQKFREQIKANPSAK